MPGDNFKGITSSRQSGFNQATDTLFHQISFGYLYLLSFLVKNSYKGAVTYNLFQGFIPRVNRTEFSDQY
jgi:hypothetical protein